MRNDGCTRRILVALLPLALALAAAGCNTEPYCVGGTCGILPDGGNPDGGDHGDGSGDVTVEDGANDRTDTEGGGEVGDGGDADADADATCDADTMTDPLNCGSCGNRCNLPHAFNDCVDGVCVVASCDVDWWDNTPDDPGNPESLGCEYYCHAHVVPGHCDATCVPDPTIVGGECDTSCNLRDDDCNGVDDDCVDMQTDPLNCGTCGNRCRFTNAEANCADGHCVMGACLPGYWDENGTDYDGCEYECGPRDGSPPPAETCNNLDDDCDGETDEGNPGGGTLCGPSLGTCVQGTLTCVDGALTCVGGHGPTPELCDDLDNDCDGVTDNSPTDVGHECGTRTGWCDVGTTICLPGGVLDCDGDVEPRPETCNGIDDDCDGIPDNHLTDTFDCTHPGVCVAGTPLCDSGVWVCDGEIPGRPETCNGIDDDCDTVVDNGYNLSNDPLNCGSCGHVCSLPHATAACTASSCTIAACATDYWNANGTTADGCEYSCVRIAPNYDTCNGRDDDCDTLTDALDTADFPAPPSVGAPDYFCNTVGACAGPTVSCGLFAGSIQWHCNYPAAVRTDATGTILPETLCDGVDEDCDGTTDENWPGVRHSAADGADACSDGVGVCLATGTYVCTTDHTTQHCSATRGTGTAETCNGRDDDCDGVTDNFAENYFTTTTGAAVRVTGSIDNDANGSRETARDFYIMRWEASRPDATSAAGGSLNNLKPCSVNGVLPWTNVSWTQARDACCRLNSDGVCHGTAGAAGSRWALCPELDWQLGCERSSTGDGYLLYPYGEAYVATTCNGNDYDTNPGLAGDQDDILATQTMANCRNAGGFPPSSSWIYDASGNVKEWTSTTPTAGYYRIRGGASNNSSLGLTCTFNFTVGSTGFTFPNLGFRCCYYP